jgi:F-type H+-transporting ATPase subunit b
MTRIGLPRIAVTIDARRQRREDDLARAARLKTEAEAASAAFQRTMSEARTQAQAVLKETSDRLAAEAAERQHALAAALGQQIEAAERQIAATKEQALREVRGIAIDVGRSVVEKLTGAPPDGTKLAAAVDSRLAGQVR